MASSSYTLSDSSYYSSDPNSYYSSSYYSYSGSNGYTYSESYSSSDVTIKGAPSPKIQGKRKPASRDINRRPKKKAAILDPPATKKPTANTTKKPETKISSSAGQINPEKRKAAAVSKKEAREARLNEVIESITRLGHLPTFKEDYVTYYRVHNHIKRNSIPPRLLELLDRLGYSGSPGLPEITSDRKLIIAGTRADCISIYTYLRDHNGLPPAATKSIPEKNILTLLRNIVRNQWSLADTRLGAALVAAGYSNIPGIPNEGRDRPLDIAVYRERKYTMCITKATVLKELAEYMAIHNQVPLFDGASMASHQYRYLMGVVWKANTGTISIDSAKKILLPHQSIIDNIVAIAPDRKLSIVYVSLFGPKP